MALAAGHVIMPAGENTLPDGRRKSLRSQGATAEPPPTIQAFAFATMSPAGATSLTRPIFCATAPFNWSPLNIICKASPVCIRRDTRCEPPAPGNRPILISGRPTRVLSLSDATR